MFHRPILWLLRPGKISLKVSREYIGWALRFDVPRPGDTPIEVERHRGVVNERDDTTSVRIDAAIHAATVVGCLGTMGSPGCQITHDLLSKGILARHIATPRRP